MDDYSQLKKAPEEEEHKPLIARGDHNTTVEEAQELLKNIKDIGKLIENVPTFPSYPFFYL